MDHTVAEQFGLFGVTDHLMSQLVVQCPELVAHFHLPVWGVITEHLRFDRVGQSCDHILSQQKRIVNVKNVMVTGRLAELLHDVDPLCQWLLVD